MNTAKNSASAGPSGILVKNNLIYSLPPDLSVAVERRTIRQYSQGTEYSDGQRCTFVLNTGADFVDFTSSYLAFDFALTAPPVGAVTFSQNQVGSACNVINRITISTRSGDEITRIDNCNVLASQLLYTDYDSDYYTTMATNGEHVNTTMVDTTPIRCLIPLERLSGFFKYDKLAPSPLCSGLRIEILFENAAQALNSTASESTLRYKITQPSLVLEQHRLTDAVSRAILSEAASNGLEVVISDWFHSLHTTAEATVNAEVRKAVSRAQKIMAVPRVAANENRFDENAFIAPFTVLSWRYRLGSSYFPNQPVVSELGTPVEESYYVAARTFDRHRSGKHMKMTPYEYVQSHGILAYPLERQASMDLSGIPVNNSRILSLDVKFAQSQSRLIDFYMKRVLLCRVFLSNTETEE